MKNKKNIFMLAGLVILLLISGIYLYKNKNNIYINSVLNQKAYSSLPEEAKEYIKNAYEETGELILTENNKKTNVPYLNPQYVEYLTYSDEEKAKVEEIPIKLIVDYVITNNDEAIDIPSSYDLRNVSGKNYITPNRNQGNLGICWAFATAGAAESYLLKTTDTTYNSSSEKLISERQIDYATAKNGIKDYTNEYVTFIDRELGSGGNFYVSTIAMANGISLIDYNSFKSYNDKDLTKMELSDVLNYSNSLYEVDSTLNIPILNLRESTSELTTEQQTTKNSYKTLVKENIMTYGASYVSTFMDNACQYIDTNLNNTVIDIYNCSATGAHAMEIIGWDDNKEYSYCADTTTHNSDITNCTKIVSGKGVWILKNSWGTKIQYPYLTYDSLNTQVGFITNMNDNTNKNWDNNYLIGDGSYAYESKQYSLSDTKIKDNETIKKVKFIAYTSNTTYNVNVYKNDSEYETFTVTAKIPGLVTVDIDKDIVINKNTKIKISSNGYFIDKLIVFTKNIDNSKYVDLSKYNNIEINKSEIRLYSNTKNIASKSILQYKLYNSSNEEYTSYIEVTNNVVAENNINTLIKIGETIPNGIYRFDVLQNNEVITSTNVVIKLMEGTGTENDPYVITNAIQLSQIRNDLDGYYILGNNIDLLDETYLGELSNKSGVCNEPYGWQSINNFSGTLDGKGYTISNLYQDNYVTCQKDQIKYNETRTGSNGLFGIIKGDATIKNLILKDFEIECYEGNCGVLASDYISNVNEYGNIDVNDEIVHNFTIENVITKNCKITSEASSTQGGGLLGYVYSSGKISISNIYLDINNDSKNIQKKSSLMKSVQAEDETKIKNIQVTGDSSSNNKGSVLINQVFTSNPVTIENVVSTITSVEGDYSLINSISGEQLTLKNINMLNIENKQITNNNNSINISNVNIYNPNTQLEKMTNLNNYNTWENFDSNWNVKTIDGIKRIPVLKNVNFNYTSVPDITYNQTLNATKSIYSYITLTNMNKSQISYLSNNEDILKIDDKGTLIPLSTGNTIIHIENIHDGFIKDVPITVNYKPHYIVKINMNYEDANVLEYSKEVSTAENYTVPVPKYLRTYYEFINWNTKPDGTGITYEIYDILNKMNDKEEITLYAQWLGYDMYITFNANGGSVSPSNKYMYFGDELGELPVPIKNGYGFRYWKYNETSSIISSTNYKTVISKYKSDIELTADWVDDAYTIAYYSNGGKIKTNYNNTDNLVYMSESLATTYAFNDANKTLSNNLFDKKGYIFKEWNTKQDGTGTSYSEEETIKLSSVENSLLKLYAIWEKQTGNITFNSNYGTPEIKIQSFSYYDEIKLNKNIFKRMGYIFKEWNTKPDGTGTKYIDEQITTFDAQDVNLYAQWTKVIPHTIKKYVYDENTKNIKNIMPNTTVESYKENIELLEGYTIDVEYKTINNKKVLFTGSKTRIYFDEELYIEFTNIVSGDTNKDGKISYIDYVNVYNHIQKTKYPTLNKKLLENECAIAGDYNLDNKINYLDYVIIYNKIKELKSN